MNQKRLGFGLMRLPMKGDDVDVEKCCALVDAFLAKGFNYFDTAWMYCNFKSERATRDFLVNRHPRECFTLTTKLHAGFINSLEDRDKIFNTQLENTGAGYFDYYLLHDINSHSIEAFNKYDCFTWIQEKKNAGLIKHMGFSFHDSADLLEKVLTEHPEFEFVQLQLNYLDWESNSIQSRKCYETAVKHNMKIIVMEPVKGGTLATIPPEAEKLFKEYNPSASVPSWAIRYVASLPNVIMVLSGMNTVEMIEDNTAFMDNFIPVNEDEKNIINQVVKIINSSIAIPCTGCEYCLSGCPKHIPIPRCFSLFNADKQEVASKGWTPQGEYYDNMIKNTGKASDCIACKKCEGVCPQHLPIVKHLKEVAEYFGK